MKCLNLYAVVGAVSKKTIHQALIHYPVFADDKGIQHILLNGVYKPLSTLSNLIRTEPAELGN